MWSIFLRNFRQKNPKKIRLSNRIRLQSFGKFADRRASNSILRRPFASEGAFLTIKVLKKGTSEKEKQSLVLAMFPTIAETRKLAICIQHIVAMKRGYGEKLLVGGDSVTLTSNLLACELTDVQKQSSWPGSSTFWKDFIL